jgi:GNAT superfamily N-acetyltransferase
MISISTDDALLDVGRIHHWLSEDAYWSLGRSREKVERSLRHSVNVGAYEEGQQIGFLRIVTDRATFAWVCDVYVDPLARGHGVGRLLMAEADRLLTSYGVRRAMLATADAHGLYARHGFAPLAEVELWMSRGYER